MENDIVNNGDTSTMTTMTKTFMAAIE